MSPVSFYARIAFFEKLVVGWFKNPVSCQSNKLMACKKFSDYLGVKHNKNQQKMKYFIHLRLANWPQSLSTSPAVNSGHWLKKYVLVM